MKNYSPLLAPLVEDGPGVILDPRLGMRWMLIQRWSDRGRPGRRTDVGTSI
jgi:hypothetical protein